MPYCSQIHSPPSKAEKRDPDTKKARIKLGLRPLYKPEIPLCAKMCFPAVKMLGEDLAVAAAPSVKAAP